MNNNNNNNMDNIKTKMTIIGWSFDDLKQKQNEFFFKDDILNEIIQNINKDNKNANKNSQIMDEQVFTTLNTNYDEINTCPLCHYKSANIFDNEYCDMPILMCEKCYYTVYTEVEVEEEKEEEEDTINVKSMFIHYAVDCEALDNARNYYCKHNTLPFLTNEERELWRVKNIISEPDQTNQTNQTKLVDVYKLLEDNTFMSLLFVNVGIPVNHWYLNKSLNHCGVYTCMQISNGENTPYNQRQSCTLSSD